VLLPVLVMTAIGPARAEAAPVDEGPPASLAEAVAGALERAGQLIRAEAFLGEADAVRRQAGAWIADDPALRLKGVSDRFNSDDGAYELEALVELPLWLPGQRRARLELARSLGLRADALERLLRWEVAGAVRDAVWAAKLADVQLQQASAAHTAAQALEAVVAKRHNAGELARFDLLTAKQETLARQAELTAARAAQEQAKADYAQLTGLLRLPEPANSPQTPLRDPRQDAAVLPDEHPLLAEGDSALASARSERDRVASDRRGNPVLSLGGKRTRDARSLPADAALQLEVSIPFGLPSQSAPEIAASERQVTERLAELHRLRREAERELVAALLGRRGAAEALQVAERRARLAADALAVAERAFELGETDLAERLRAERRAREANLDLALRRAEQGQALARVNQALGIIPE
jgi:outer membrane protein TolC